MLCFGLFSCEDEKINNSIIDERVIVVDKIHIEEHSKLDTSFIAFNKGLLPVTKTVVVPDLYKIYYLGRTKSREITVNSIEVSQGLYNNTNIGDTIFRR